MRNSGSFPTLRPARPRPDIAVCYGTRPQVIKVARLVPALRARWNVLTVDTGQHYDYALNEGLYHDLDVTAPSVLLGVGAGHPVEQTARIAAACAQVLMTRRPRIVVVIGDTNSTLGCAVAARQLGIPVVHVEAGLRSGVLEMAEERNRVAVDAMSQLLCAPSPVAVEHLRREGVAGDIVDTGDVSRDVLQAALGRAPARARVAELPASDYGLATLHRAELTDSRVLLERVLSALGSLDLSIVLPLHPRTERRLREFDLASAIPANVRLTPPLGYLANLTAIRNAALVITDSGGVQREAYWLGTPCITLRNETEWTETVQCGANRLVPPERAPFDLAGVATRAIGAPGVWTPDAYGNAGAAEHIADAIESILTTAGARTRPTVAQ